MSAPAKLRFSRLRLLGLTLADLALVMLAAAGMQQGSPMVAVPSALLLALAAAFLLLLTREWFSPSYIEFDRESVAVKWNNWRLRGRRARAELSGKRPRSLELEILGAEVGLDPVGPLHLAAMLAAQPFLSLVLPPFLSRLYYLDAGKLRDRLGPGADPVLVRFPASLFGKRRIRHALEKSLG